MSLAAWRGLTPGRQRIYGRFYRWRPNRDGWYRIVRGMEFSQSLLEKEGAGIRIQLGHHSLVSWDIRVNFKAMSVIIG